MKNEKTRGYDDSDLLKQMADGIFEGKFSSVSEAAKHVLREDGGSNVDRLRRKYRDERWFDRAKQSFINENLNTAEDAYNTPCIISVKSMFLDFGGTLATFFKYPVKHLKGMFLTAYYDAFFARFMFLSALFSLGLSSTMLLTEPLIATVGTAFIGLFMMALSVGLYHEHKDEPPQTVFKW